MHLKMYDKSSIEDYSVSTNVKTIHNYNKEEGSNAYELHLTHFLYLSQALGCSKIWICDW